MSSERTALIAAIREAPDDDALRLVCADWFEDQGDEASVARAEFIRTQIARASLPPEDIRQSELQARELRLLKRYGSAWCGAHFLFRKVRFRRGFIEYVHLHLRHFLHHRRQILALEPVRDISLTGWYRAPTDLIRRVANCEEWKYIETLRIHHQGPHKDPGSDIVILLESPHLTRLRSLYCTSVVFDSDARRRFERLALLRSLSELVFPDLDTLDAEPGSWFEDGGTASADQWAALRSLSLPYYLDLPLLRQLTERAFWNQLTELSLVLSWNAGEALAVLRERMPAQLQVLHLGSNMSPAEFSLADPFFERLARAPLQGLHLTNFAIDPSALGRLLHRENRWELRELTLRSCDITAPQARILADAPSAKTILSLNLSANWDFRDDAAWELFSSPHLRSIVHLDLGGTRIGKEGAEALAAAEGWDRLRALNFPIAELGFEGFQALLASPKLQSLVWLGDGEEVYHWAPGPDRWPPQVWGPPIPDDGSMRAWRATRAPEQWPPLDAALERPFDWR